MSGVWGRRRGEAVGLLRDYGALVQELGFSERPLPAELDTAVRGAKRGGDLEQLSASLSKAKRHMIEEFVRREAGGLT
ncbi:MAG: hypothetical protein M3P49_16450 [Actinomycetota bacterium]|nr:hypothetical protein [Actinomycetota bacterium]